LKLIPPFIHPLISTKVVELKADKPIRLSVLSFVFVR